MAVATEVAYALRQNRPAIPKTLLDAASGPYRRAGRFAYHFARGKLRTDPVFGAILELGLLRGCSRILDLGCGQGLLTAWLRAAQYSYTRGDWPQSWPPAPESISTCGIELMAQDVKRAQAALGAQVDIQHGDIRTVAFGNADAVVILDVLHYLSSSSQHDVLRRVRETLPPGGLLLLRVGDANGGLRFRYTLLTDRVVMLMRGHGRVRLHCRSVSQWHVLLRECGFDSAVLPMSHGTPFANVLLIARAR
jgi:SAM-dependent methyltransferase